MSVSGGITPHLITKLIQIFLAVTLNEIFVTLNVTLKQSQIMSVVCDSEAIKDRHCRSNWFWLDLVPLVKGSYLPNGAIAQSEIALKCQRSLFFEKSETITRKSWNCD